MTSKTAALSLKPEQRRKVSRRQCGSGQRAMTSRDPWSIVPLRQRAKIGHHRKNHKFAGPPM